LTSSEAGIPVSFSVVARDAFSNVRGGDRTPSNLGTGSGANDAFRVRIVGGGATYLTSTAVVQIRADAHQSATLGGSFTITYKGATTPALPVDVSADTMKIAIETLLIGTAVNITRAVDWQGYNGFHWNLTFVGDVDLTSWDPQTVAVSAARLTGDGASVNVTAVASYGGYPVTYTAYSAGIYDVFVEDVHGHGIKIHRLR
jgi:hypothetical protein